MIDQRHGLGIVRLEDPLFLYPVQLEFRVDALEGWSESFQQFIIAQ